ncbi:hemerythrin domain-containing protein [Lysobacter sp. GX 14042]|uniref:hemerythrin domain-containing protein n=1 Tax=Lysobacter sp. GX 14042 TaxID=2907155 RepID=UPI001F422F68|nr:hemerythrin domain-containing protein [Lysobacter sp. GX 14042]MCE7032942.1 hemerythrin domain-containing protein [Lysobacter sp. GX 14042]
MARDILKTLKSEHDELRKLFDQVNDTTDRARKTRTDLLERIEASFMPHARWEEQVFYPEFRKRADRDGLKTHAEAVAEHKAVEETVIPDVHAAEVDTPEFAGRIKVFGEMVEHHAREEEQTMFKMARELFTTEERAQLDEDYEQWKQSAQGREAMVAAQAKTGMKDAGRRMTH